ncbi:MAG: hypothetical protein ACE141_19330 [Bryobacteraceae bacterium]
MNRVWMTAILALLTLGAQLPGATLERMSLDQMIARSTGIVRGRITGSYAAQRGPVIYTRYSVQVLETWKGQAAGSIEVSVPGGTANGLRQSFSGAPRLTRGAEYVLFLWTGRSGMTQVIGLSQGVFTLIDSSSSGAMAVRPASSETMLDPKTLQAVRDETLKMPLSELKDKVSKAIGGGSKQ